MPKLNTQMASRRNRPNGQLAVLRMLTSKAVVHESIPSTNIPSVDDPRGFAPIFDPDTGIFTIWIAWWLPRDQAYFMIS